MNNVEEINQKNLVQFLNYLMFDKKLFEYEYLQFEKEINDKHHEFYQ